MAKRPAEQKMGWASVRFAAMWCKAGTKEAGAKKAAGKKVAGKDAGGKLMRRVWLDEE